MDEIAALQGSHREAGTETDQLVEALRLAEAKLGTIERSLFHHVQTSVDVHKQIFEDSDAMEYLVLSLRRPFML